MWLKPVNQQFVFKETVFSVYEVIDFILLNHLTIIVHISIRFINIIADNRSMKRLYLEIFLK